MVAIEEEVPPGNKEVVHAKDAGSGAKPDVADDVVDP